MVEENLVHGLYDRQIRLFGQNTQSLIENAEIYIIEREASMREADIGGEIVKNLALLGVKRLVVSPSTERSYKRLAHRSITEINPHIKFEVSDFGDAGGCSVPDLVVMIDTVAPCPCKSSIYVCSRCMSFGDGESRHVCGNIDLDNGFFVNDCLLGAILVQEWVKKLQGKEFTVCYKLRI
jgi:hypothetical protein